MGFRNPLRTAIAVDTGQPAGAGVRTYQQATATGTRGVVEFRDGIAGDAPSVLTASANLVPQGGGYTAQGGAFTMDGGSWNGVDAGKLEHLVVPAPGGGYEAVTRLTADRIELVAATPTLTFTPTGNPTYKPLTGTDFADAASWQGDEVVLQGIFTNAVPLSGGASQTLYAFATIAAALAPAKNRKFIVSAYNAGAEATAVVIVNKSGVLSYLLTTSAPASGITVDLDGVRWRPGR